MTGRTFEVSYRGRPLFATRTRGGWHVDLDGNVVRSRFLTDALSGLLPREADVLNLTVQLLDLEFSTDEEAPESAPRGAARRAPFAPTPQLAREHV